MKRDLDYINRVTVKHINKNNRSMCTRGTSVNEELFAKFLSSLTQDDFTQYQTVTNLKESLSDIHSIDEDCILVTPGSDYAIQCFFNSIPVGSDVAMSEYHFPMYDVYCQLNNLNPYIINQDDLSVKISDYYGQKYAIVTNPQSPTGVAISAEKIRNIADNVDYLLVDEAYIDYCPEYSAEELATPESNIVVTRTFSKGLSGAGIRAGYAFGSSEIISCMSKFRSMFELAGPSIKYAEFVLKHRDYFLNYCKETNIEQPVLIHTLASLNIDAIKTDGNWIHVLQTDHAVEILTSLYDVKLNTSLPGKEEKYIRLTVVPGMSAEILTHYENNFAPGKP